MPAKHLILGFDAFDLSVVRKYGRSRLPHLYALMDTGTFAHQQSVFPPATLPNWISFLTGVNPATHGVFDFTIRDSYEVRFHGGTQRASPFWLQHLDKIGKSVLCSSFPGTYPPMRLQNGIFISGWDSPVSLRADRSFVHPPSLHDKLVRRHGEMLFGEVDQFRGDDATFPKRLRNNLINKIEVRTAMNQDLLDRKDWDLALLYYGEADTAAHYLWALEDNASPRHVPSLSQQGMRDVYMALDDVVGRMRRVSERITILSDHGAGGASDRVVYLNRVLASLGFLTFKTSKRARALSLAKKMGPKLVPPSLRRTLFRAADASLPSRIESAVRFGNIDFKRTAAFSDELNYFPAIYLNMEGRERQGSVADQDRNPLLSELEDALLDLEDPVSGAPLIERCHRREDLFAGPHLNAAPDLIPEFAMADGYSYNLMPSSTAAQTNNSWFRKLSPEEYLGVKGRSLPGSHRKTGFALFAGPDIAPKGEVKVDILETASVAAARSHVFDGAFFDRPVRTDLLKSNPDASPTQISQSKSKTSTISSKLATSSHKSSQTHQENRESTRPNREQEAAADKAQSSTDADEIIAKRLRALGYLD